MKKILICGERSFVATGLSAKLDEANIDYDCFSRGELGRDKNRISGDIFSMSSNTYLDAYETIINFIIVKDKSIDENIAYIKELLKFCELRKVKHLIHISSISVYPNEAKYINESSDITSNPHLKGGYAGVKVAVDQYLLAHPVADMHISFVRPGYIYAKGTEISKAGILKSVSGFNILFGDKKTTLPLINRALLHEALIKITQSEEKKEVYLLLNKNSEQGTKYNFVKNQWGGKIIPLPRFPLLAIARLLKTLKLIKPNHYSKVIGLFKNTNFDSSITEQTLNISFAKKQFCVIGAGAYGSYICNLLCEKFPHEEIYLFEVGNETIKDEAEIGYLSSIKTLYTGLQKGRFFGLGGATVKWGGQLFTFSDNDFTQPTQFLKEIVDINKKWKDKVFSRFNLHNDYYETRISNSLFVKTGIWLGYFNRNLYKFFRIGSKSQLTVLTNRRVVKLLTNNDKQIVGVEYLYKGERKTGNYDRYFLATGAFESARLLLNSCLVAGDTLPFSDHLSQRVFKVKSGTTIGGKEDFAFLVKGTSLITKRMVGEVDGVSFFCHPIYNADFPFFQNFKKLLFGHSFSFNLILNIIRDIPSSVGFAWNFVVKKKMYVYKNEFYFQIDIENPFDSGSIRMIDDKDKFGEKGVEVDFIVDKKTEEIFTKAKKIIREYFDAHQVIYEELKEETKVEKYEDTYHPFGIYSDFESSKDYFHRFGNLLITNTGILPRAGGINSTCAVFPLIEEYIENEM
ncbi:MAG: NAD-dependent epimerase/dehydratase family protein [Paludibacter sp.]|nr:NAD-dependent epimerase/dehydratase family protein [Paludibacter sp.]